MLLEKGANPNAKDIYGFTALHFRYTTSDVMFLNTFNQGRPFEINFEKVAIELIAAGTDVNAVAKNPKGYTPLMAACAVAPIEIIRYLLSNGANINLKTETGATAFSIAQARKRDDVLSLLNETQGK